MNPAHHGSPVNDLAAAYLKARMQTTKLAEPLSPEDCQAQSMPDASPVKWHLAHVTWFFETFVLEQFEPGFKAFNPQFRYLFNSYYNAIGDKHPRPLRGLLTRPAMAEVMQWRSQVDERVAKLLATRSDAAIRELVTLGIHHEQQHQELLITDVKHLLSFNALNPVYRPALVTAPAPLVSGTWVHGEAGVRQTGHEGPGFSFDNECPRHSVFLQPYELFNRLVTQGEWFEFMCDGGYRDPRWWLSAGWDWAVCSGQQAPLYWRALNGQASADLKDWAVFTLQGQVPVNPQVPVAHVNYFEAEAFARWKAAQGKAFEGARLPTEAEWEAAVASQAEALRTRGNFLESGALHPVQAAGAQEGLVQALGDVWEWTSSSYAPYPGFTPWAGAAGEYNGKFMVNQYVLRGGSCATPRAHIRASYRNFFPTEASWQFSGLRLARDRKAA